METISYNKEILTATGEMIRLFSNISIFKLHDDNGHSVKPTKSKKILVPLKYAQTSRILKSIMNPTAQPQEYPLITLEKNNISFDLSRNSEIHHDIANLYGEYDPDTHPPIPVNIEFTLTAFGKYPEDVDMIIGNFAPWFNSDVFVTTPHPKLNGKFLNHQLLWSGEVTYNWKSSLQSNEQDIITASTGFTYKTELFAGYEKLRDDDGGIIHKVIFDFSRITQGDELYSEYDESKVKERGNMFSGFYSVPYGTDFELYAERMVENTLKPSEIEYDSTSFNCFNEAFDNAVMNGDFEALTAAAADGANMHKHSYWPYAYASSLSGVDENYAKIVEWLDENGSLKPNTPHFPPPSGVNVQISDL